MLHLFDDLENYFFSDTKAPWSFESDMVHKIKSRGDALVFYMAPEVSSVWSHLVFMNASQIHVLAEVALCVLQVDLQT